MRVRFAKLSSILLATTALSIATAEVATEFEARLAVRRLVAQHEGLSVGSVDAGLFSRQVVLRDVTSTSGGLGVSIGRLTLPVLRPAFRLVTSAAASPFDDQPAEAPQQDNAPGPAEKAMPSPDSLQPAAPKPAPKPAAQAPAATPSPKAASIPGTASAENVTITSGSTTYRIKHIELTGTSLTNADVASLLDQTSSEPVEARLKKLSATSIVAPEIIAEDTTPGSERQATARQVALSGVVAGRITAGSIDGTTFTAKSGDDSFNGETGAIKGVGIDLPQVLHVVRTVRTDDAEPLQPLYDSVVVAGIKVTTAKGDGFSFASVKETGLKGRPMKTDTLTSPKTGKEKPSEAEQAAIYDDLTHSFSIASLQMDEMVGHGHDSKGRQTFGLADFTVNDFANAKIGGMSMQGFTLAGPGVKVSLGNLRTGPLSLPPPKNGAPTANASQAMLPGTVKVDLTKLDIASTPDETKTHSTPFALQVAHAGFSSDGDTGEIPRSSNLTIDNVAFDLPQGDDKTKPLIDMGYSHLDVSLAMTTTYDATKQEMRLRDLTFKGDKMGSVALGLQLINVTKGIVSPDKEIAKASAVAVLVKGLSFDLVNEGLVDRLLEWKAKQDGMSVADEKAFAVDLFTNKLPGTVKSANVKIIGDAMATFIQQPKNLHIELLSKSGLGVGAMSMLDDPALLIDTLEVKASANK